MFQLHSKLAAESLHIARLQLCEVRLMNNKHFPWVLLVPAVEELREITDLMDADQHRLMDEISLASGALQTVTQAEKMNIAALGNQVSQLHVHVIARFKTDIAWPQPVWGTKTKLYGKGEAEELITKLRDILKPRS